MFVSAFLLPFAFALCVEADSPGPLIVPFTVFIIGLFWTLYFQLFGEETAQAQDLYRPPQFGDAPRDYALPPQQTVPAADFTSTRHRTAEIIQPPSVTENTTKLLDQD